jgi:hypothetical protein
MNSLVRNDSQLRNANNARDGLNDSDYRGARDGLNDGPIRGVHMALMTLTSVMALIHDGLDYMMSVMFVMLLLTMLTLITVHIDHDGIPDGLDGWFPLMSMKGLKIELYYVYDVFDASDC